MISEYLELYIYGFGGGFTIACIISLLGFGLGKALKLLEWR